MSNGNEKIGIAVPRVDVLVLIIFWRIIVCLEVLALVDTA